LKYSTWTCKALTNAGIDGTFTSFSFGSVA
jgi:hypothetical protein